MLKSEGSAIRANTFAVVFSIVFVDEGKDEEKDEEGGMTHAGRANGPTQASPARKGWGTTQDRRSEG